MSQLLERLLTILGAFVVGAVVGYVANWRGCARETPGNGDQGVSVVRVVQPPPVILPKAEVAMKPVPMPSVPPSYLAKLQAALSATEDERDSLIVELATVREASAAWSAWDSSSIRISGRASATFWPLEDSSSISVTLDPIRIPEHTVYVPVLEYSRSWYDRLGFGIGIGVTYKDGFRWGPAVGIMYEPF